MSSCLWPLLDIVGEEEDPVDEDQLSAVEVSPGEGL